MRTTAAGVAFLLAGQRQVTLHSPRVTRHPSFGEANRVTGITTGSGPLWWSTGNGCAPSSASPSCTTPFCALAMAIRCAARCFASRFCSISTLSSRIVQSLVFFSSCTLRLSTVDSREWISCPISFLRPRNSSFCASPSLLDFCMVRMRWSRLSISACMPRRRSSSASHLSFSVALSSSSARCFCCVSRIFMIFSILGLSGSSSPSSYLRSSSSSSLMRPSSSSRSLYAPPPPPVPSPYASRISSGLRKSEALNPPTNSFSYI
mmetsp:Transcript_24482/g.46406  ORF Transcript_24482/g.46406 Transcript_24482/m.46406 type:complete len:263 (-) Transcript_24482:47-835(-)